MAHTVGRYEQSGLGYMVYLLVEENPYFDERPYCEGQIIEKSIVTCVSGRFQRIRHDGVPSKKKSSAELSLLR